MKRLALLALPLLGLACAHAPTRVEPPDAGAPAAADAGYQAHVLALAQAVAEVRGLPLLHPVPVVVQPAQEFRQAFRHKTAREARLSGADKAEFEAEWVAFGFVAPAGSAPDAGVSADRVAQVASGVLDEQIAGYYDEFEHRMHLPDALPASAGPAAQSPGLRDYLVAHELEHALQDQHFGFAPLMKLRANTEARLATNAVFEGDAVLASLLHLARATGVPEARLLELTDHQLSQGELTGMGRALDASPPVLRERLLFPYAAGFHLCLALYRTGGFTLVDALFSHPPQTAEQLLHPEKYASGEQAVPVATPAAPAGFAALDSGTLGELGARVVALEALPEKLARPAVEGWGGDSYRVAARGKQLVLLWTTAWDDASAAARFELALQKVAQTWTDGPPPESAPSYTISRQALIQREGTRVVLVRGLDPTEARGLAPALLAGVGAAPPPAPPLGKLVLAGPPQTGAVLPDGAYGSEPWALYVPTPPGFRAVADPSTSTGIAVVVIRVQPRATGTFGPLLLPFTHARARQVFRLAASKQPGARAGGASTIDLGWARGDQQDLVEPPRHTRTVVAPACDGRASWVFQLSWTAPDDERSLMEWLSGFAPHGEQPACGALK